MAERRAEVAPLYVLGAAAVPRRLRGPVPLGHQPPEAARRRMTRIELRPQARLAEVPALRPRYHGRVDRPWHRRTQGSALPVGERRSGVLHGPVAVLLPTGIRRAPKCAQHVLWGELVYEHTRDMSTRVLGLPKANGIPQERECVPAEHDASGLDNRGIC